MRINMITAPRFIHKVSAAILTLLVLTAIFAGKADITKVRAIAPITPVTPPNNASNNGNAGGGGVSTNTTGIPACTNTIPSAPSLFQAKTTLNSATLYFTPRTRK